MRAAEQSYAMSYASTPSSHESNNGQDLFDGSNAWSTACNSADEAYSYSLSQPMMWPSAIHRYQSAQASTHAMPVNPGLRPFINRAMPGLWPMSTEAFFPSETQHATTRHDSVMQNCHLQSAFLPSQPIAPFHALQDDVASFRPEHEMSPGRSEYSVSSQASGVASSSPYAHSEGCFHRGDSPTIKLEEDYSHSRSRLYSVSNSTSPRTQHVHVKPGDIYSPPDVEASQQPTTPARMLKVEEDSNPILRTQHSSQPLDATMEDMQLSTVDDRNKRGYTTPMNAVCSCDMCGKLFQRSSNLKAHMETHRPDREQPWACQYHGCTRRFVRKTDMTRHQESVSRPGHCV